MNTQKKQFGMKSVVIIIATLAILFGGAGLTNAAAQSSIPGDALYPVKTTIERTRLSFSQDAGDRAQMKMDFAEKRLDEVAKLINEGRFSEIRMAVLAFESEINGAILELDSLSKVDPARAARLAQEITSALTRYAESLVTLAAVAPENVRDVVARALDTTQIASGLDMPEFDDDSNANTNESLDDNGNLNSNDDMDDDDQNSNESMDDDGNLNSNESMDDDSQVNGNSNDDDGFDDNSNTSLNSNDDNGGNSNGSDDSVGNSNTNDDSDDSNSNTSTNTNGDDSSGSGTSGKGSDDKGGSNSNGSDDD